MASTNHTNNYNLPQFISSDKPAWLTDINSAFSDIDSAIKNVSDAQVADAGDITTLNTTVGGHTTDISNLQAASTQHGNDITNLAAADITMSSRISTLESAEIFNLLWTNADPSQTFSTQTINIDTSAYRYIAVDYLLINTGTAHSISIFDKNYNARISAINNIAGNSIRDISVQSNTEIFVGSGRSQANNTVTTDNSLIIPCKIYGIK